MSGYKAGVASAIEAREEQELLREVECKDWLEVHGVLSLEG